MGQPNTEPSMEDILASIKRIIAEDGEPQAPPGAAQAPRAQRVRRGPVAVPDPEPVHEVAAIEAPPPPPEATDEVDDVAAVAELEEPAPRADAETDLPSPPVQEFADVLELTSPLPDERGPILSGAAEQASRSAFAALSQLQIRAEEGAPNTLEGLVADLLKPMLREYLDRELPGIVERIVAAEVKRVSGR